MGVKLCNWPQLCDWPPAHGSWSYPPMESALEDILERRRKWPSLDYRPSKRQAKERSTVMKDQDMVQTLKARLARLEEFRLVRIPVLRDLDMSMGTDISEHLNQILAEYKSTLEAWLQQIERQH